jgi:butyryl-CoA dehydrogenase
MVYEMCRKFADEELAPNAGKWDKEHSFPREAIDKLVSFRLMISCLIKYVGLV